MSNFYESGLMKISETCQHSINKHMQNMSIFVLHFSSPRKKIPGMAPNGAGRFFFLLIQTLPTFWAERTLILRICIFGIFWDPKFPDFQVPDFQNSRNLAWAQPGPKLGPWLGPGLGPRHGPKLGPGPGPRLGPKLGPRPGPRRRWRRRRRRRRGQRRWRRTNSQIPT